MQNCKADFLASNLNHRQCNNLEFWLHNFCSRAKVVLLNCISILNSKSFTLRKKALHNGLNLDLNNLFDFQGISAFVFLQIQRTKCSLINKHIFKTITIKNVFTKKITKIKKIVIFCFFSSFLVVQVVQQYSDRYFFAILLVLIFHQIQ